MELLRNEVLIRSKKRDIDAIAIFKPIRQYIY
jgi:hypothetical protein